MPIHLGIEQDLLGDGGDVIRDVDLHRFKVAEHPTDVGIEPLGLD
jgi:hypothetical protein